MADLVAPLLGIAFESHKGLSESAEESSESKKDMLEA